MTREEAIEIVKTRFDKWALADEDLTALQVLGLIDTESEDERVRKALINIFAAHKDYEIFFGVSVPDIIAYLEKLKEQKPVEWSGEKCLEGVLDFDDLSQIELAVAVYWKKNWECYQVTCKHQKNVLQKLYSLAGYDYDEFNHKWEDEK